MSSEQKEKSTPRPWRIFDDNLEIAADSPDDNATIAWMFQCGGLREIDEAIANAQLIVTAVNERNQLLSSLAEKQEEVEKLRSALREIQVLEAHKEAVCQYPEVCAACIARIALNPISEPQEHEPESEKLNNA